MGLGFFNLFLYDVSIVVLDTDNPKVYIFKGKVAQKLNNLSMSQPDDITLHLEINQL